MRPEQLPTDKRTLILASSSPRRQDLIQLLGLPWIIHVANVDEESIRIADPKENVLETARLKASYVAARAPKDTIILGADTTVVLGGKMLGKPNSEEDAHQMLLALRGRSHEVHTGISVIDNASGRSIDDVCSVDVPMREYSAAEIELYIATGDPMDKAGSYAIQHEEFRPVSGLRGCYAAVVGLPLCHVVRALDRLGVEIHNDVPAACQQHHNYNCPIFESIIGPVHSYGKM